LVVEKVILGIVQALTEFLPVSSSGHLVLLKHLFGLEFKGAFYETFLHTATFLSVIFVLRDRIFNLDNLKRYIPLSMVGILPLFPAVFFLRELEGTFENPKILPFTFLITSLFLFLTLFFKGGKEGANFKNSLIMGLAQALALLPGVSRSGSTISTGLFLGMDREEAFILSFWIFLPASIGAFILESRHIEGVNLGIGDAFVWLITFVVGIFALKVLRRALLGRYFWAFSLYTLFLSLLSFFLFFTL
jgi:undecaprenyl-diphosphatase